MATYTVKQGDTLNRIAQNFGYQDYKAAGLTAKSGNPDLIRPGETFSINQAATSPAKNAYVANLTTGTGADNGGASSVDTAGVPTGTTTTTTSDPFSSYRKFLSDYQSSLSEDSGISTARTNLADIQNLEDKTSLEARKAYEDTLNNPGMLKSGALEAGAALNKDNSYILANLGVAEGGAARKLSALTDSASAKQQYYKNRAELAKPFEVAGSYYDPITGQKIDQPKDNAAFELSPGQARYAYNPTTKQYEEIAKLPPLPKEPTKQTEAEKKQPMIDDINSAVSQLGQIVKAKGFKGVSPDDYNTMRAYLQTEYGYEAVAEFDKALDVLGLTVDYGSK